MIFRRESYMRLKDRKNEGRNEKPITLNHPLRRIGLFSNNTRILFLKNRIRWFQESSERVFDTIKGRKSFAGRLVDR